MTPQGMAGREAGRLQGIAEREALRARKRSACAHRWQEAQPPRTAMPDGREYLTSQCPRCGAVKLRGRGRPLSQAVPMWMRV